MNLYGENKMNDISDKIIEFHLDKGIMEGITIKTTQYYFDLVFKNREYDSEMYDSFLSLDIFKQSKPIVIFDVGGFMGVTGMLFAKLSSENSKVIIFEPNPYNYDRILENLSLNPQVNKKIEVSNIALSDKNGIINMNLSSNVDIGHSSTSRISNSKPKIDNNDLPEGFSNMQVKSQTLDTFVNSYGGGVDIIKIDIEGAEHFFLLGAVETIRKYKPIIYIELHSEYCALECTQQLLKMGYEIEVLKEEKDHRLFCKAIYSGNQDKYSEYDFILARQDYNNNIITKRFMDIEEQIVRQSQLYRELFIELYRTNKELIEQNKEEIKETIKNTGIYGLLRRIKHIFIK